MVSTALFAGCFSFVPPAANQRHASELMEVVDAMQCSVCMIGRWAPTRTGRGRGRFCGMVEPAFIPKTHGEVP